jgi:hypothetical protein
MTTDEVVALMNALLAEIRHHTAVQEDEEHQAQTGVRDRGAGITRSAQAPAAGPVASARHNTVSSRR